MDAWITDRLAEIKSREALRFEYVDEQGWDTSCGYASLATLLHRYRDLDVNETDLIGRAADGDNHTKANLASLVGLVRGLGLLARPWRASFDRLPGLLQISVPLLVHYDRPDGHFALLLACGERGVVTADPARGLELLTRSQFLARWSGVVVEVVDAKNAALGRALADEAVRKTLSRSSVIERALSKAPWKRYFEGP